MSSGKLEEDSVYSLFISLKICGFIYNLILIYYFLDTNIYLIDEKGINLIILSI